MIATSAEGRLRAWVMRGRGAAVACLAFVLVGPPAGPAGRACGQMAPEEPLPPPVTAPPNPDENPEAKKPDPDAPVVVPPVTAPAPPDEKPKEKTPEPESGKTPAPGEIPPTPMPGAELGPVKPPEPTPLDAAALEKAIGEAITKGVAWLKQQQLPDGSFGVSAPGPTYGGNSAPPGVVVVAYDNKPGIAALCLLALLKSDVPPSDPVIVRGFKFLYDHVGQKGNKISCYEMGVTLMAVEALYEATLKALLKKEGKKVTERPGEFKEPRYTLSLNDSQFCQDLLKRIARNQTRAGGWRYGEGFSIVGSEEDLSATQVVMLGLKAANRMRLPVDPNVVRRAVTFALKSQEADGPGIPHAAVAKPGDRGTFDTLAEDRARGWAYEKKSEIPLELVATGSMTTAGITTLLIGKSILGPQVGKKEAAEIDQAVWDGFAWLSLNWSVTRNPKTPRSHMYFLYGLERVGTLGMFQRIVTHAWYAEGADVIVRLQTAEGCWDSRLEVQPSNIFDTCFALLFLRRGTVPIGDVLRPRVYTGRSGYGAGETKGK
jgi:hypothetical protein